MRLVAITLPTKRLSLPSEAEPPTCQNTLPNSGRTPLLPSPPLPAGLPLPVDLPFPLPLPLAGASPFFSRTTDPASVINPAPIWNTNAAPGSPCASSTSSPVRRAGAPVTQYTPGVSVSPPRFCPERSTLHSMAASSS